LFVTPVPLQTGSRLPGILKLLQEFLPKKLPIADLPDAENRFFLPRPRRFAHSGI
jgi:hypothetical protein